MQHIKHNSGEFLNVLLHHSFVVNPPEGLGKLSCGDGPCVGQLEICEKSLDSKQDLAFVTKGELGGRVDIAFLMKSKKLVTQRGSSCMASLSCGVMKRVWKRELR